MESLTEGASDEVVAAELDRLLGDLLQGLAVTGEALASVDVSKMKDEDEQIDQS
jgi:hypothetical protein